MTANAPAISSSLLKFHPQRDDLFNELHTRPFPVVPTPGRVSQIALLHEGVARAEEQQHIASLCKRYSINPPSAGAACYYQDFGGFEFRWERHTEFSTYTFIHQVESPEPFLRTALALLPDEWLASLPGRIISGVHLEIESHTDGALSVNQLRHCFEGHRILSSYVRDRKAQLWTAYRIHSDGMGRIFINNMALNPCQTGRLVRRMLELETYRMMALLALPLAKQLGPEVNAMDQLLAAIIQQITQIKTLEDERRLLSELTRLAACLEQRISDTNYRFAATKAYYELAMTRLDEMREQEVEGLQTLHEFLSRRLTPAWRTCETVREDLEELSSRIDRASELLRTRVDLAIEAQNQALLQSMDRRSKLQLHMQQTVEGLSVAVISYYLVGLVKHLADSAKSLGWIDSTSIIVGAAVPIAITGVWFVLNRFKKRLDRVNREMKDRYNGKNG